MRTITHPHIVALVDILESTNHIHLIMEFCQLGDLATFVKKRDKLAGHPVTADMIRAYPNPGGAGFNEVIVRHFAKQLASALEFLRSKNLVHRDLKPQNLLLNPPRSWIVKEPAENRPYEISKESLIPAVGLDSLPFLKIADFGFARHLPTTTMAETLCGSPLYMAPEILRYEKYDAKADLWSVGAVLYELMVGKPPFRAANHVDLLRKIERTMDKIRFPDDLVISNDMSSVIRGLLKKMPTERMSWDSFFQSEIVVGDIPGLVGKDRTQRQSSESATPGLSRRTTSDRVSADDTRRRSSIEQPSAPGNEDGAHPSSLPRQLQGRPRRPSLLSHVTAPTPDGIRPSKESPPAGVERRNSSHPVEPYPRSPRQAEGGKRQEPGTKDAKERTAQDIAFERDYVMVEKRAVEVNAFADELAASPQIQGQRSSPTSQAGPMVRRGTTSGTPASQAAQDRQMAMRPDSAHQRRGSYERKYGASRSSAQSALAAALNMVNIRFNVPGIVGAKGPSPPKGYGPYPAFPASAPSPLQLGELPKPAQMDEDQKVLSVMEESATRSDVVYGFAEVKYRQLIPIAPSNENVLGMRRPGGEDTDEDDLLPDAVVGLSEEALVLYVKSCAILTNTINMAGSWFGNKRLSDGPGGGEGRSKNAVAASRINNVVQWARNRFNECLEKTEYVSRRLQDAQHRLPVHHQAHPSKHASSPGHRRQDSDVTLTSGITAEKLMYDRAIDMSKSAAVNELVNEDLAGCEVSYLTAVRLLEAVLEKDGDSVSKRPRKEKERRDSGVDEHEPVEGMEDSDRKTIFKRKLLAFQVLHSSFLIIEVVVEHTRTRLAALRKKMAAHAVGVKREQKQNSARRVSQEGIPATVP